MATEPVERTELAELEEGLDAVWAARPVSEHPALRLARAVGPRLGAVAVVILVWQLVVALHVQPTYALPSPGEVWATLVQQAREGNLTQAIFSSLLRAALVKRRADALDVARLDRDKEAPGRALRRRQIRLRAQRGRWETTTQF